MTLFNWLDEITLHKRKADTFKDEEWVTFNSFLIHKYISMEPKYIEIANYLQKIPHEHKKQIYNAYKQFLPKKKVFFKYIGSKKQKSDNLDISFLSQYFECSEKEANEYADLLGKDGVQYYIQKQGTTTDTKVKKKKK